MSKSRFTVDPDLAVGTIFEVVGSSLKIALSKDIKELTRSHNGRVYDVGQIGSILKVHMGRQLIFATVRLLRLQSDEESAALGELESVPPDSHDRRVIEADLLGEGGYDSYNDHLTFKRGVSTYPLPLQTVYLTTKNETEQLYGASESSRDKGVNRHVPIGTYVGASNVQCTADMDKLFGQHCAVLGSTGSGKSSAVAAIVRSLLEHVARKEVRTKPSIVLIDPHGEYASSFRERGNSLSGVWCITRGGRRGREPSPPILAHVKRRISFPSCRKN